MQAPLIAFIGAGNMATSIIAGLVNSGHPAQRIRAADPSPDSLARIADIAPVTTTTDNAAAAAGADVVILAVKPQVMAEVLPGLASQLADGRAVAISIAVGVTIERMQSRLGPQAAIVRCMPNTPSLLGCGVSALFANPQTSAEQRAHAEAILSAVGSCSWVEEEQLLDAVAALSGSGPAYLFYFLEAMIEAGVALGLDREAATGMALDTALGAARMGLEGGAGLTELRRRVTSPGGTTEAAIASFSRDGLDAVVARAMQAASDRAAALAREMG